MKKLFAAILALALVLCSAAMAEGVMSYADYMAAEIDDEVTIECYVQAHQSWWDNKITVYAADQDGAYFIYNMACSEEDAAKLEPGTKIRVNGFKAEWSGVIEIAEGRPLRSWTPSPTWPRPWTSPTCWAPTRWWRSRTSSWPSRA